MRSPFHTILLAAFPLAVSWTLSWFGVFTFVNAYVIRGLGCSNADWTALTLWFTFGTLFWQVLCTEISCRIGRRPTIVMGLLLVSCLFPIVGYVTNLTVLGIILALISSVPCFCAVIWLSMVAEAGGLYPGRMLSWSQLITSGFGALALIAGGQVIVACEFRLAFILCGAVCAVCAVLFYRITRSLAEDPMVKVKSLLRLTRREIASLANRRFILILLAGICIEPFNFHTANQLFPNLARDLHGFNEGVISTIVGMGRLPALASLWFIARYIDRLNPTRCYGVGLVGAAFGLVLMGVAPGPAWLIAGYVVFYLGHGLVWGSNLTSVNACVDVRLRESAFALTSVGMVVAMFGVGVIHHNLLSRGVAVPHVFIICAGFACVGGIVLLIGSRFQSPGGRGATRADGLV